MPVVYTIRNLINGKTYIGFSKYEDADIRWRRHVHVFARTAIYKAIQKYGVEFFEFEIIFRNKDEEIARGVERRLITLWNTYVPHGYNICEGGGAGWFRLGFKHSEESKLKISKNHANFQGERSGKAKLTESQVLKIIAMYKNGVGVRDLGRRFNIAHSNISGIVRGKRWPYMLILFAIMGKW